MSVIKILAYVAAAILILFGVLFIWAAFGQQFNTGWFLTGLVTVLIGFGLIWFGGRQKAAEAVTNVTLQVDLPANVNMDSLKCQSCGGVLGAKDVKMVAGAPVVTCPYCGSTYQLTEEPKW